MKNLVVLLISFVIVFSAANAAASPNAAFSNGDFEQWNGSSFENWKLVGPGTLERGTILPSPQNGTSYARITSFTSATELTQVLGAVSEGQTVIVSGYTANTAGTMHVRVQIKWYSDSTLISSNNILDNDMSGDWLQFSNTVTAPSGVNNATIVLMPVPTRNPSASPYLFFDNISVTGTAMPELPTFSYLLMLVVPVLLTLKKHLL